MTTRKKILVLIIVMIVALQFNRTEKNEGEASGANDITNSMSVPVDVKNVLERACYDCHSNHTNHMWYENIQPIGWWIGNHIIDGKDELNFSEFNNYKIKRKAHKMEEIFELVEEEEMPLPTYLWMHQGAKLTQAEKEIVVNWAKAGYEKLKSEIPEGAKK